MNNEQLTVNNEEKRIVSSLVLAYFSALFLFVVFTIEVRRRRSSLLSLIIFSYSVGDSSFISLSKSSQYSVSEHSLREIAALAKNSFLLIEYCASLRFAPIDVPECNSCLASVNSCFSSHRYLYRLYIFMANFLLFSNAIFFIPILNIQKSKLKSNERAIINEQLTINNERGNYVC